MAFLRRLSFERAAVLLAGIASAHSLIYIPLVGSNVATDSRTYEAAARAIEHGTYTTPLFAGFYFETKPPFVAANNVDLTGLRIPRQAWYAPERQTFRPPGYPLYLAALGGGGRGVSRTVALFCQALLFGVGTWLLALTVRRWWGSRVALLAAGVYAVDPWSKHYVALILTETLAGLVVLAAAYTYTRAWGERTARWWAATAALAAALTLVRAVFVVAVPLVLLAALVRDRVRAAVAASAAALILLVPWFAWTASVTDRAVLASYGEGFNLLVAAYGEGHAHSFADVADDVAFRRDFASVRRLAPPAAEFSRDPTAHPRYLARADERLRDLALDRYETRLADEPAQVAWETGYRMFFLWNAHDDWYQPSGALLDLMRALDAALLVLAAVGIAGTLVRPGPARGVAIFVLAYTAVLGLHHVEARFAIPLRGIFLAYVSLAVARFLELVRSRRVPHRGAAA